MSQATEYYVRQIAFPGIGPDGQARLAQARVVLVGCGGTGSVVAEQLTRAGVGHLRLIDRDFVEWDNLARQVLYDEADAEAVLPKAVAAAEKLARINSGVQVEPLATDLNADNVMTLLEGAEVVVDGTDNFETRFLLNDACVKAGRPWIYCAAVASHGLTMTVIPGRTACLRCLVSTVPGSGSLPTCATAGVVNPVTGLVASLASAEAMKLLVGTGELNPGLVVVDLWDNILRRLQVERRADCPTCVGGHYPHLAAQMGSVAVALCGRDAVQLRFRHAQTLDLEEVARRLASLGQVERNQYLLRFRAEGRELVLFDDGRAVVKGVSDPQDARRYYSKYVGL